MADINAKGEYVVGVDMGGTKILAGVFNASLDCVGRFKMSTKAERGPAAVITANNVFAHIDNLHAVAEGVTDRPQEERPAEVPPVTVAKHAGDAVQSRWDWVEPAVWTRRMLQAIEAGVAARGAGLRRQPARGSLRAGAGSHTCPPLAARRGGDRSSDPPRSGVGQPHGGPPSR